MNYTATLYDKTGKNKLGELTEILAGGHYVEEERNGIFEMSFDYPNGYPLADLLINENIVEVKPNDTQNLQKFRIYDTKCLMKDIITVLARHESFDLANDHVENVNLENASCEYALNTLFRNSHFSTHYRGYSDIINAQNYKIDNVNILNAIAGKEGSIIDTYGTGAEILRDGTNIHVLNKRGHDNEVTIEFGKNLTDFVLERDLTDLETRVGGFAKYTPEGGKETIVKSNWIDSPYIDNFAHPYINIEGRRDYSDKFKDGEVPTVDKLNKLCEDEFKINKRDIPKSNYTIKFIPLSKCVGYEGIQDKISLCDTVRIIDKRFNVDTKAKVIKYKYDFVKERYESMELGEPRTTLGDVIGGSSGEQGPPGKDGQNGKDGEQGPPGQDGNVENMPDTLPNTPVLTPKVYGMGSVELSWTFENKLYYTYELYASRTNDFAPNFQDLIHAGQSSSFLFKANPDETWYFKVCAMNSHNRRTGFSNQVEVALPKIEDLNNYFSEIAIGHAVAQSITTDYMEAGMFKGHWIDTKNLSCTDGNGKRTFNIDSFGRLTMMPTSFKLLIDGKEEGVVTQSAFTNTIDGFEYRFFNNTDPNLLRNSSFLKGWNYWYSNGYYDKFIYHDGSFSKGDTVRLEFTDENQGLYQRGINCSQGVAIKVHVTASRVVDMDIGIEGLYTKRVTINEGWNEIEVIVPPFPQEGTFIFYTKAGGAHTVYANRFKIQTGNVCTPWSPHREEIYSNTTTIDGEGIQIKHDNGSMSKFTHEAIDFFNSQGRRTLRIKDGGFNFHTWQDPAEMVGFIKSSVLPSTPQYNGVSLSTYGHGDYISIGTSTSTDENSWVNNPNIFIATHGSMEGMNMAGTWFLNKPVFLQTRTYLRGIMDIDMASRLELYCNSATPHMIYNSSSNNLAVMGDNKLVLGTRYGESNMSGINIVEDGSSVNKVRIESWGSWNFNNFTMYNMKNATTLQAQSIMLRSFFASMPSQVNDIYGSMSTTDGELRHVQREPQHITNKTLIVELPHVFSENIENDYHVNISKLSWGDYRIVEKTPYYFEIETDVDDFSFTYEVVAKKIEKSDPFVSIAGYPYLVNENNNDVLESPEEFVIECEQKCKEAENV